MSAPPWVARLMQTQSGLDRLGRAARVSTCGKCGAHVLRGLDDDRCALTATVDPHPLTTLGEACAILRGRWTYWAAGRPLHLHRRDHYMIRGRPADRVLVLADHVCGDDLAAFHRVIPDPPPRAARSAIPPF